MPHESDGIDFTPEQARPALHMLAISIPLMSALYGALLRMSLSYAQLFHRLDPFLFRLLVGILVVLVSGQVACITAEGWYLLTTTVTVQEDLETQRIINACTQVSTTLVALLCQGFYIERLFATTKNVLIRSVSILLWMLSISLFIAWNVKYLLHNGPHLNGDRKYNLGAASLWALALATSFVTANLIYFARLRKLRSPKRAVKLSIMSQIYQLLSLSIQTFALLTLNHFASAIGFTASLVTSSNSTSAVVAFFFFNLFPGLSVFSVVYTLNQRNVALWEKRKRGRGGGVKGIRGEIKNRTRRLSSRIVGLTGGHVDDVDGRKDDHEKGVVGSRVGERERGTIDEGENGAIGGEGGVGIHTGLSAEDDPSNWRGDVSQSNSISIVPFPTLALPVPSIAGDDMEKGDEKATGRRNVDGMDLAEEGGSSISGRWRNDSELTQPEWERNDSSRLEPIPRRREEEDDFSFGSMNWDALRDCNEAKLGPPPSRNASRRPSFV